MEILQRKKEYVDKCKILSLFLKLFLHCGYDWLYEDIVHIYLGTHILAPVILNETKILSESHNLFEVSVFNWKNRLAAPVHICCAFWLTELSGLVPILYLGGGFYFFLFSFWLFHSSIRARTADSQFIQSIWLDLTAGALVCGHLRSLVDREELGRFYK